MKIKVVPRQWLMERAGSEEEEALVRDWAVISLNTPGFTTFSGQRRQREDPPLSKKFWRSKNVLTQWFHDVNHFLFPEAVLFSEDQAREIAKFFREMRKEGRDILIHCTAGISRSQAVGMVLNKYANIILEDNFEEYEEYERENYKRRRPNSLVRKRLTKALEEEFKKEVEERKGAGK